MTVMIQIRNVAVQIHRLLKTRIATNVKYPGNPLFVHALWA